MIDSELIITFMFMFLQALALRGWIELMGDAKDAKKALKLFDESLQ